MQNLLTEKLGNPGMVSKYINVHKGEIHSQIFSSFKSGPGNISLLLLLIVLLWLKALFGLKH